MSFKACKGLNIDDCIKTLIINVNYNACLGALWIFVFMFNGIIRVAIWRYYADRFEPGLGILYTHLSYFAISGMGSFFDHWNTSDIVHYNADCTTKTFQSFGCRHFIYFQHRRLYAEASALEIVEKFILLFFLSWL